MENLSIKKVLAKLLSTRMVIESGTSGIWTYRKWSDGTAECWGMIDQSFTPNTAWGSTKYTALPIQTFPSGLFNSTPKVTATASKTSGNGIPIVTLEKISNTTFAGFIDELSGTVYTYPVKVSFYAIGTWATQETDPENPDYQLLNIDGFVQNQMSKAEVQALIEASGNIFKENDTWTPSNLT